MSFALAFAEIAVNESRIDATKRSLRAFATIAT
jgi:hypothetical protein